MNISNEMEKIVRLSLDILEQQSINAELYIKCINKFDMSEWNTLVDKIHGMKTELNKLIIVSGIDIREIKIAVNTELTTDK